MSKVIMPKSIREQFIALGFTNLKNSAPKETNSKAKVPKKLFSVETPPRKLKKYTEPLKVDNKSNVSIERISDLNYFRSKNKKEITNSKWISIVQGGLPGLGKKQ